MAYDEGLAERLRNILDDQQNLTEKKMFGGLCLLLDGKMCCGIVKDELMVRVGAEQHADSLKQPHARPMDFTGRPMKGFVFVGAEGLESERDLERWIGLGVAFARATASSATKTGAKRSKKTS